MKTFSSFCRECSCKTSFLCWRFRHFSFFLF